MPSAGPPVTLRFRVGGSLIEESHRRSGDQTPRVLQEYIHYPIEDGEYTPFPRSLEAQQLRRGEIVYDEVPKIDIQYARER
ncbi:hypothetical protein AYI69_g11213 [Smittium culicis]|uniref:Uncharacterized protein n=1 Tax=Smittium culicis TaxID=133412 RepID=A0A1R1X0C3_9FUNG|nr:hypothetical protein AYI69_g11213 [Smittium culicis]